MISFFFMVKAMSVITAGLASGTMENHLSSGCPLFSEKSLGSGWILLSLGDSDRHR